MSPKHRHSTRQTRDRAALYTLGALAPDEKTAFEEHLRSGCPACESDLRSFENVAGQLGFAATPIRPPGALWERVLDRVATSSASQPEAARGDTLARAAAVLLNRGGLLISRSTEMRWEKAELPGIFVKTLFVDRARKYSTALVRMEPGTTYPSHRHTDVEELYMLEGDLWVEGQKMGPGDYCRGEPDSIHGEVRTDVGALFLVLSSAQDELLA